MATFRITDIENDATKTRNELEYTVVYDKSVSTEETFTVDQIEADIYRQKKAIEGLELDIASRKADLELKEELLEVIQDKTSSVS